MTRLAATIPDEGAILCENCGYILTGLPSNGLCPECGKAIAQSDPDLRKPAPWDDLHIGLAPASFLRTTGQVLFRPKRFFRHLATRSDNTAALWFALIHWCFAGGLFSLTAHLHWRWYLSLNNQKPDWIVSVGPLPLMLGILVVLKVTTDVAARLTAWEAAYRGLRMPINAVRRGMYYHAAHYAPVAIGALLTVAGYQWLLRIGWLTGRTSPRYLYVLCTEVLVAAFYLFETYWIGMKNMMYANR